MLFLCPVLSGFAATRLYSQTGKSACFLSSEENPVKEISTCSVECSRVPRLLPVCGDASPRCRGDVRGRASQTEKLWHVWEVQGRKWPFLF
jgi:hypothetical protein